MLWLPIMVNVIVLTITLKHSIWEALTLGLSLCFIASYGFLINDLRDLQADRYNKAGKLENAPDNILRLASNASVLFLTLGLSLVAVFQFYSFLGVLMIAGGLTVYTFWIRPKLYLANVLAAFLASSPLWLPNLAFLHAPDIAQIGILAVAVLLLLGREIIFDIADHFGDARMKRRTISIVSGDRFARRIAVAMQFSGCGLLIGLALLQGGQMSILPQLLLYASCGVFVLLVVSANMKVIARPMEASLKRIFTMRTRLAMLVLPVLLFLLIHR